MTNGSDESGSADRAARGRPELGVPAAKILVVDDEPLVCEILVRWLDAEGYNCHWAGNGTHAMRALAAGDFSLMIADIRMPDLSGLDLLAHAREHYPDMAVIMLTVLQDRETALKALRLGAYAYVTKPLEANDVIISVVNALERRRLTLERRDYERRLEEKARQQTEQIRASREELMLRLLAAQEYRHDETGAHVRRIGLYSEIIARRLGYPEEGAEMLRLGAPMHDIGKIGIPDHILAKAGPLTPEEREIMKTHTTIGARILDAPSSPLLYMARDIALNHHERWDGSGYPSGLRGPDIPEAARIVSVLDCYDALVHDRVYRPALPEDQALATMSEGRGTQFDPELFDVFLDCLDELRSVRARFLDPPTARARAEDEGEAPGAPPASKPGTGEGE